MFTLEYTSSIPQLLTYVDEQFKEYLQRKSLREEQVLRIKLYYDEERRLLTKHVYNSPQNLNEMCFMAFLGYLAKEKGIKVSNVVIQCPFICYLLGVISYDVFEEEAFKGELYPKGSINSTNYYVDEKFYENCKEEIKQFLEQSGYVCMWEGKAPVYSDSVLDREPIGLVVLSMEEDMSEHEEEFGKLYDGTNCVLEENSLELYPQGEFYQFLSMQQERLELTEEELKTIEAYKNHETDKETVFKNLASGMIDNIYSREGLYRYLLENHMNKEQALYWTEMIRKGVLKRKLQRHEIAYSDYAELYIAIGKEKIDLFSNVRYLPSYWSVLEKFYRLTV